MIYRFGLGYFARFFSITRVPIPYTDAVRGKLSFPQLTGLINDVAAETTLMGLSITQHMPWDAINLKNMMEAFVFMK